MKKVTKLKRLMGIGVLAVLTGVMLVGCTAGMAEAVEQDTVEKADVKEQDDKHVQDTVGAMGTSVIRLNQLGYQPTAQKVAFVTSKADTFNVYTEEGELALSGQLEWTHLGETPDVNSGDILKVADFTKIEKPGKYRVQIGEDVSSTFHIGEDVYEETTREALKFFYYQRCGELDGEYADFMFAHPPCHQSLATYYDKNAPTYGALELEVCGGWHDAGDFGKYVTAGSKAVVDLLLTIEHFPEMSEFAFGGPELLLGEVRYELEWMLKMQDSQTGGVFHKVTTQKFPGDIMPEQDKAPLLIAPISAQATADFAAVMAYASRMYEASDSTFSAVCLEAAERAWAWLEANPEVHVYNDPAILETGDYGDHDSTDERFWAAAELFRTTGDTAYEAYLQATPPLFAGFGWQSVAGYGMLAYVQNPAVDKTSALSEELETVLVERADYLLSIWETDGYKVMLDTYEWGSNKDVCDAALLLINVARLTGETKYDQAIEDQLHYVMGRNANNISYITGMGQKAAQYPHHRQSTAARQVVKGMLVGGPYSKIATQEWDPVSKMVDDTTPAAKCYRDIAGSFASNEVTIYWNSPLIYMLGYMNK